MKFKTCQFRFCVDCTLWVSGDINLKCQKTIEYSMKEFCDVCLAQVGCAHPCNNVKNLYKQNNCNRYK